MRKLLLFVVTCFLLLQAWAQNRTVTGKVTDEQGKPVANASVSVKGTTKGTITKEDGTFSLAIAENAKSLVVTSVGFTPQELPIGNRYSITFVLASSDQSLGEIVITGYSREKKSQFTGAAVVLSSKTVEEVPVGSFDQALQGRAPGMLVNSSSGQPGSSATVTIRGVQSIQGAGAQPLYVLDGIPIPASDFQTLNPNDFESLTILKDAGAGALYGARGGTGVIVITTKKGRAGATKVMARSQLGITKAPSFDRLNLMNAAEILSYEERLGSFGLDANQLLPGWAYSKNNPTYAAASATEKARRDFSMDSLINNNLNIPKLFYREGLSQSHEINMSGGSDKTRFFLSAGIFDQEGIDLGAALRRYTTRFNIEHTSNKLTVQWNTALGYSKTNYSEGEAYGNSPRNAFQMTYRAKPYENPFKADGSYNFGVSTQRNLKQIANVLEGIQNSSLVQNQVKINTGLTVGYKLLPSVTLKNTFGIDVAADIWQRYIKADSYVGTTAGFSATVPGLDVEGARTNVNLINTSSVTYAKHIDKHDFEVGAYFEVVRNYQKGLAFTLYALDPRLPNSGQGAGQLPVSSGQTTYPQNANSAKSGFGIRSYFGTGRYTYDDKYTVTGSIRRDGTSRIANNANKEITTWAAGLSWNAIKEDFLRTQHVLSDLKVRFSYGVVPNIGSIATNSYNLLGTAAGTWMAVSNYLGPQIPSFANANYAGGGTVTGTAPSTPGNSQLKIENIRKANLGVDFAVWHNRARFTVEAYRNETVDLFVSLPLAANTGFGGTSRPVNAGRMRNQGLEFMAAVDVVRTHDFDFTFGWNHAINSNKITDLGGLDEYPSGTFIIRKGLPYGTHYTRSYLGADPATGRPRFETLDGKEVNTAAAAPNMAKWGTYLPKHVGGFTFDFRYKGFTIGTLFSYQFVVTRSNNIRNWITRGTSGYQGSVNGSRELLTKQWLKPGDNAFFQSPVYDRDFSSSDLENAKFLRFRNINVAYQIPAIAFKGTNVIKGAKVYAQMQNVAVWSPWTGLDPEDGNNISLNEYPNPKMIVAGIDINF
ncbi:TonB-linked SusC/RagA family outer membrane protein [Filimonas zeae]|uniref:SusC/RagA family TonB-linked outer membrane protein n=1 Tax=Filimonas zeae TaxID=1737353 RepID=UPI001665E1CB|nr:SusC/RagA family TonB-linked outer membrane protein [Filimonas zeae]MDR6341062.1 TonB-linked SusC/RagA family outer membrane protein [Filimonas zeae]